MADDLFTAEQLREALSELAHRVDQRKVAAAVRIVGGAALALSFYDRAPTQDIDALVYPPLLAEGPVLEVAAEMAKERGWRPEWFNTQVRVWVPPALDASWTPLLSDGGVEITVAPPDLLLAMKLNAGRGRRDARDIEVLLEICEIGAVDEAEAIFEHYYPGDSLKERAVAAVRRYVENMD